MPEDSFHEYVRARMPALFRVAYLLCGDAHLADDLVQHALIRVASRWERVVSAGDPDAYVRKIIYHQHVSWWRRRRGEAVPVAAPPDRNVGDATAGVATSLALRRALARLTSKQRAVLVLHAAMGNRILDLTTGESKQYTDRNVQEVVWSPDGRYLAAAERYGDTVLIYDTIADALRQPVHRPSVKSVAFSPDGTMLAVQDSTTLFVFRLADGSTVNGRGLAPDTMLGGWKPDSTTIALISPRTQSWQLHFYDVATGTYTQRPDGYRGTVTGVAGWRSGEPVVTVYLRGADYPSVLAVPGAAGELEILARARTRALSVPAEVVGLAFGDHTAAPSVFAAHWAVHPPLLILLLLVVALGLVRLCSGSR